MLKLLKMKVPKIDWVLVGFLFVLLFGPPVIPDINTALFAGVFALVMLLTRYRRELRQAIIDSGVFKFFAAMVVFFIYLAVVTVVNIALGEQVQLMHYVRLWYRFFLIVPMLLVCSLYVCLRAKELNYGVFDLAKCFLAAVLIQVVLALLALLLPQLKAWFVSVIYANTGDRYMGIPWIMQRRGFGFSNSFADSFGWGMGLLAALPLFFVRPKRYWPILLCPVILFVSLVNVRTGLIIAALGLVISVPNLLVVFRRGDWAEKKKMLLTVLVAVLILALLIGMIYICNPVTLEWILGDVISVSNAVVQSVIPGNNNTEPTQTDPQATDPQATDPQHSSKPLTTTADTLFSSRFWNIPLGWALVFGTGHTIYEAEGYPHSDVGYVNDLWMGGIVGSLLLYGAFALLFVAAFKSAKEKHMKLLVLFFAASMLAFQVKANATMFNAGTVVMLPMLFFMIYDGSQKAKKEPAHG